jgi:hypothetical protein
MRALGDITDLNSLPVTDQSGDLAAYQLALGAGDVNTPSVPLSSLPVQSPGETALANTILGQQASSLTGSSSTLMYVGLAAIGAIVLVGMAKRR